MVKENGLTGFAKHTVGIDRGNILLDVRINANNSEGKRQSDIRPLEDVRCLLERCARSYDIRI